MAKPVKKNRRPIEKVDLFNLPETLYLNEKGYGEIHDLSLERGKDGVKEYVYHGKLHKGNISLVFGKELGYTIPTPGYNHGFTLEGKAQEIFTVDCSLMVYNAMEHRFFCYINPNSELFFKGNTKKDYSIYFRIYDNVNGENNNRWVVIYAEEM